MRKHNPAPRQRDDDENEVNALYWALRRQQQKQAEENRLKCISEMEEAIKDLGLPKPQCQTMYQFRITHNEVKLDIYFAEHHTNKKVVILCSKEEMKAVQTKLCEKLGGEWVWVDSLAPNEAIQFTDNMPYHGYTGKTDRYSDQIITV